MERERYLGCLVGLACGDAVGTTVEFKPRGTFAPLKDMVGGGPFDLPVGAWTDDTSMALCLATSLIARDGFDAVDQMERYCRWWREGYLSSTGRCFDIGNTVSAALRRFEKAGQPFSGSTDPAAAGNGSLMRLAPVVMFFADDRKAAIHHAGESSRTTHRCAEAVDACRLFASLLLRALGGASRSEVLKAGAFGAGDLGPKIEEISSGGYLRRQIDDICGTGYVVRALEAALWCFAKTDSFRDAILAAANLGDDADTTAAICGQIAGAHYGLSGIPEAWRERLVMREHIEELAHALYTARPV